MGEVQYPRNPLTEAMESLSRINAAHGHGLPVHTGEAPPAVRSAAMREPQPVEEPLTPEEHERLNALARAAGIQDPRLGNAPEPGSGPQSLYDSMSLEEVMALSAPVHPRVPDPPMDRMTAREAVAHVTQRAYGPTPVNPVTLPPAPRIPNFRNVQGIDLIEGVVYVDDLSFTIPKPDVAEFRRYAVEIARAMITQQMDEALDNFAQMAAEDLDGRNETGSESMDADVQREPERDRT